MLEYNSLVMVFFFANLSRLSVAFAVPRGISAVRFTDLNLKYSPFPAMNRWAIFIRFADIERVAHE